MSKGYQQTMGATVGVADCLMCLLFTRSNVRHLLFPSIIDL